MAGEGGGGGGEGGREGGVGGGKRQRQEKVLRKLRKATTVIEEAEDGKRKGKLWKSEKMASYANEIYRQKSPKLSI